MLIKLISLIAAVVGAFSVLVFALLVVGGILFINANGLHTSADYLLAISIAMIVVRTCGWIVQWADA